MTFGEFAYRVLHPIARKYWVAFKDIEVDLKRAELPYSIEEYFAMCIMTVIFASPSFFVFLFLIEMLVKDIFLSIATSAIFTFLVIFGIVLAFYLYPSQAANSRKKKIDDALHFASIYMTTLAETGAPPYVIFRILGTFDEFGEIAKVARKISRDVDVFGMDISEAITRATERVPSEAFRELLWGMRATITSGGDLKKYLAEKGKGFTAAYKRRLEDYTNVLSIFMEIYITVVVVGSVFALVLTTIMSLIGGGEFLGMSMETLQLLLVGVGMPLMTAIFVVIIKSISPGGI